jgi:hypothetical protein
MGRKKRNRIKKSSYVMKDPEEIIFDDSENKSAAHESKLDELMYKIQVEIKEYINSKGVPMCEYMDPLTVRSFLLHLSQSN